VDGPGHAAGLTSPPPDRDAARRPRGRIRVGALPVDACDGSPARFDVPAGTALSRRGRSGGLCRSRVCNG